MAIPKGAVVIAALIALAASGCTQPDPNAKPTYACTPSQSGTPQPCYKAEHDLQAKEDALYAEAEAVYRKYLAEDERIYRAGGVSAATPIMLETLTGGGLQQALETYRELISSSTKVVDGHFELKQLRRAPREQLGNSVATLESCIDGTSIVYREGKTSYAGNLSLERAYFSTTDEGLKISSFKSYSGKVATCGQ
ncbi:MAG: hypothetical protein K4304_05585 [Propionicimonas sp.]